MAWRASQRLHLLPSRALAAGPFLQGGVSMASGTCDLSQRHCQCQLVVGRASDLLIVTSPLELAGARINCKQPGSCR